MWYNTACHLTFVALTARLAEEARRAALALLLLPNGADFALVLGALANGPDVLPIRELRKLVLSGHSTHPFALSRRPW
jgi:hypothetical protein